MCEESLSDYLTKKNAYDRGFAEKHQDVLKERYFKLLQDLNECAHLHWFCIDIKRMIKDVEGITIDMETLYDIERMIVSDFYDSADYIYEKLNASSTGEASYFLGTIMLRVTEVVITDQYGNTVDIRRKPRV